MYSVSVNDSSILSSKVQPPAQNRGSDLPGRRLTGFATCDYMRLLRRTTLLFGLNLLDALLTLVWVRNGVASEANHLMAKLLEIGDLWFLGAKVAIGAITVGVLLKWSNSKVAEYGVAVALAVYLGLMGVHIFTGLAAFGLISASTVEQVNHWTQTAFAAVM